MSIGSVLVFLLPFPFDLISVAGLFVLVTFLRARDEKRGLGGTSGIRDLFGSLSSPTSDNQSSPLKYYCMNFLRVGLNFWIIARKDCAYIS